MRDDLAINAPCTFESIFIEAYSEDFKAIAGEIYRVPNTNEINSINMYENIIKKLHNYKHDIIIGTDQNFDLLKIDQNKNTQDIFDTFITNGFFPTITKPTRITHTTATLIDNIYISTKRKINIHSAILTVDISDNLPIITSVSCDTCRVKNKPKIIQSKKITEAAKTKITNTLQNSSGHDGLSSSLIKDIKEEIALPVSILINKSLSNGIVPKSQKLAKVIPIYKAKDKKIK